MERAYLQWNIVNWITIVLMAALGMVLLSATVSGLRAYGVIPGNGAQNG